MVSENKIIQKNILKLSHDLSSSSLLPSWPSLTEAPLWASEAKKTGLLVPSASNPRKQYLTSALHLLQLWVKEAKFLVSVAKRLFRGFLLYSAPTRRRKSVSQEWEAKNMGAQSLSAQFTCRVQVPCWERQTKTRGSSPVPPCAQSSGSKILPRGKGTESSKAPQRGLSFSWKRVWGNSSLKALAKTMNILAIGK